MIKELKKLLKILIFLTSFIFLIIIVEIIVNIFFNKILKRNEFKFDKVIIKDDDLGWKHKKNKKFFYYHRYLTNSKKFFLETNNFGIIDSQDYKFDKKTRKIAIFGDNSISGFDSDVDSNFITLLRKQIISTNKNIEIYNFTNRDYCTLQYYNYYKKFLKTIKFDLIVYIYSHNHSRRNITVHESVKQKIFTQPLYNFITKKKITYKKKISLEDNVFLNKDSKISIKKGNNTSFKIFLYDRSYLFSIIYDLIIGKNNLKKMNFIHDLKNIEKENIDYHWNYTYLILRKWKLLLNKKKVRFVITNIPLYYNNPYQNHIYRSTISKIKERKKIKSFCKRLQIKFYDNYLSNIKKFYLSKPYIHNRYAYLNKSGYELFSKKIFNIIKKEIK